MSVAQIHALAERYPGQRGVRVSIWAIPSEGGVEYDGKQHFTNPDDYAADIERLEFLASKGWVIVRVSSRQLRYERPQIVLRVETALNGAGAT
ncbi:hypothetical protein MAGR_40940 [Mycolicibacterium agri]|nr:hypothetical protein MAGR_40940 [Mycolicibacterium agri]